MKTPLNILFQNGLNKCRALYNKHSGKINACVATPITLLGSIQIIDIPIYLIVILLLVYISIVLYELAYRGEKTKKSVLYNCTIKGHSLCVPLFWVIIGGTLAYFVSANLDKKQHAKDKEEYNLAYSQYQDVIINDPSHVSLKNRDFALGFHYLQNSNPSKAAAYLKKAASDSPYAAYLYGMMLYSGDGVVADKYEALNYFTKAAEFEVIEAMYRLMLHYSREGNHPNMEKYALEIIDKASFWPPILITSDKQKVQKIGDELMLPLFRCYDDAYRCLLDYYWYTEQYEKAAGFSHTYGENILDGGGYQYFINEALSKLLSGDRFGAKRCFQRMINSKESGSEGMREMAINYYVESILMPDNVYDKTPFLLRKVRKAEALLIENVKKGNVKSVSLLKELYEKVGLDKDAAEMSHLESYYKSMRDNEGE